VIGAKEKLEKIGQTHLLSGLDALSPGERERLLAQIEEIDPALFLKQQELLFKKSVDQSRVDPFTQYQLAEEVGDLSRAREVLERGAFGVVVVAGGAGSRLRFDGPKGAFPISPVRRRSLFQLLAERVGEQSRVAGVEIPVAIMTSAQNHLDTMRFFERNGRFGLSREQLSFFVQGTAPLLDDQGDLFLESRSKIAVGPDGNGNALHLLFQSGIWGRWWERGVRFFHFLPIDNPLADPCDPRLLEFHVKQRSEVTLKCAERLTPLEKMGLVVSIDGSPRVVEYSEMPLAEMERRDAGGALLHRTANLSLFSFSMEFVKKIAEVALPLHLAHKAARFLDKDGESRLSEEPIAWKFEKYIFDVLPYSDSVSALLYPRSEIYAALKSEEDLPLVRQALSDRDRKSYFTMTGRMPKVEGLFELDNIE
jgi:UDP-N-acetylglucosamine/UDP-N-acetylgalactosamine diphosphorylase